MDVRASLQRFEANLSSCTEDDQFVLWDRYVRFMEMKLPAEEKNSISVVLDRLVEEFLPQTRYHNDVRYINYCIKCASFYSEPINLYSFIYDKGIGNRAAVLYIAWAEQFEKQGHLPQADAVYQRAIENLAEPAELVLQQYRLFQARTLKSPSVGAGAVRNPLQDSQLTNQRERPREAASQQCSDPEAQEQFPADKTIRIISRSENAHLKQPRQGAAEHVQFVSMYCVNELVCEGSEFCFEELRAHRYFQKLRQQEELRERKKQQQRLLQEEQEEQEVERLKRTLAALDGHLGPPNVAEGNSTRERQERGFSEGDRSSANLTAELKPDDLPQSSAPPTGPSGCWPFGASGTGLALQPGPDLNATVPGVLGLTLPNSSFQQPISETPEPAIPHLPCAKMALSGLEETVRCDNTTVPFDFFPKPLPSEDPSPMAQAPPPCPPTSSAAAPDTSQLTSSMDRNSDPIGRSFTAPNKTPNSRAAIGAVLGLTGQSFLNSSFNPFTSSFHQRSFREQDVPDGAASEMEPQADHSLGGTGNLSHITPNTSLGLVQATPSRVQPSPTVNTREALDVIMDMFHAPTFHDDPFSSMAPQEDDSFEAACRNDGNVSLLGRLQVVTPFAIYQDENDKENAGAPKQAEKPQPRVLADIPVSKPLKQTDAASTVESMTEESMMWGARYNNTLAPCPNSTGDFALSAHLVSTPFQRNAPFSWGQGKGQENGPQATFCGSEEKPYQCKPTKLSPILEQSPTEEKGERSEMVECTVKPRGSGEQAASEARRLGLTQCSLAASSASASVLPQPTAALSFPEPTLMPEDDVMGSPARGAVQVRDVCMSPERTSEPDWDVPMSPAAPTYSHVPVGSCSSASTAVKSLVADPWDEDLITGLLSRLPTPLSCYPGFVYWDNKLPNISPKITLTMGEKSLHVDSILGQGAFATVYQATDPTSSNRVVLKVQKPANPWEFYINSQLDQRLQPSTRHLFNSLYSAHIFHNGSVLLGELHSCGTLLNAVNLYKSAGEKVMPQPLVLYFTICILGMVELLHSAHIVHADVKPDNFLLGERFLENDDLDPDSLEHGLTLIDLGQSIDMTLFPESTAFTAKCLTSGFQCTEMLDGRPWHYQTDYFGIAGTVYCMIFGTYMKVKKEDGVWKTNGIFKRNPHCELWLEFFHTLLNIPDCSSLPCLRGLGSRLIAELQSSYSSKLRSLKSRLVVMLLDSKRSRR